MLDTGETQGMVSFAGQGHWLEIHLMCLARRSVHVRETRVFMNEYEWKDCLFSTPDTLFLVRIQRLSLCEVEGQSPEDHIYITTDELFRFHNNKFD